MSGLLGANQYHRKDKYMTREQFTILKAGDKIKIQGQIRVIDCGPNPDHHPWNQCATTTEAWHDVHSNMPTFFLDSSDIVDMEVIK